MHRGRPRVRLTSGGPDWETRKAKTQQLRRLTKRQKVAKKPLNKQMAALRDALKRRDLPAVKASRSAAWDEVDKLAPELTREERRELWYCKFRIRAMVDRSRRRT